LSKDLATERMNNNLAQMLTWVPEEYHQALKQAYVLGARESFKSIINVGTLYKEYDNMVKGRYLWSNLKP